MPLNQNSFGLETVEIKTLGISVSENTQGSLTLVRITQTPPFRRYSFFTVGDLIQKIDHEDSSIFGLESLQETDEPFITFYSMRLQRQVRVQIKLNHSLYPKPPYVTKD